MSSSLSSRSGMTAGEWIIAVFTVYCLLYLHFMVDVLGVVCSTDGIKTQVFHSVKSGWCKAM